MSFNSQAIKAFLKKGEIKKLFIEGLGWDAGQAAKDCEVQGTTYSLKVVASKAGFKVWHCELPGQRLPSRDEMKAVHRQLVKESYEHIIIFSSKDSKSQAWLWVRREANKPISYKHHLFNISQDGESLTQKLRALFITFEEEESGVNIVDVTKRAKTAFDVEKVTKKFYQEFDKHRKVFLGFIDGIPVESDREWYASVMLNRLMFAYFIQKKGFLDSNPDYLKSKLKECQAKKGEDKFYSFYRIFLLRLFHEGLGMKKLNRPKGLEALLGNIPYLNGGMFDVHELEQPDRYGNSIEIKDEAFEKIFAYFDQYQWHLDERPLKNDKEINPDVLGYIFEKYINQKQMGAYYTKEDITEYISKSTIIPCIFDAAKKQYPRPFDLADSTIWALLKNDPDEFIYKALRHGIEHELPPEVITGINSASPNLSSVRSCWNRPASPELGLPTETWREVVGRRKRYLTLKSLLLSGEVRKIDELISLNLDVRQFALEVIDSCEDPELIWAIWKSVSKISVLDPTGGSGAFLFAALNILEPIYEGCLERMAFFELAELNHENKANFRVVLEGVSSHSNRKYYILKSIILNNLYAVDIMEEAVEICKLRLFLKLAAQVEPNASLENFGIEPLPDIDFNIRSGNALIGYSSLDEVKRAIGAGFDFNNTMESLARKAKEHQDAFDRYRNVQSESSGAFIFEDKVEMLNRLKDLESELNLHLAGEYGIISGDKKRYSEWVKTHQPFHWFVEFHGILNSGGFDVILGNPPYVENSEVRKLYSIQGSVFKTANCGNLYAPVMERSKALLRSTGRLGMIVPISLVAIDDFSELRRLFFTKESSSHLLNFGVFPSKLFEGVAQRLSILIWARSSELKPLRTTSYRRWYESERPFLLQLTRFAPISNYIEGDIVPKIGPEGALLIDKMNSVTQQVGALIRNSSSHSLLYHRSPNNFIRAHTKAPYYRGAGGETISKDHIRVIFCERREDRDLLVAIIMSSLFFWYWETFGNCRNLTETDIHRFPLNSNTEIQNSLTNLVSVLMNDMDVHSKRKIRKQKLTGDVEYDEFYVRESKDIIDNIDVALCSHYGFTPEELDFVVNYDIKYRLGRTEEDEA
jgi:hypothetical protein